MDRTPFSQNKVPSAHDGSLLIHHESLYSNIAVHADTRLMKKSTTTTAQAAYRLRRTA